MTLVRGKPSAEKYTIVGAEDLPPDTAGDSVFVMTAEPPEKIRKYAEGYAAHAEEKWTVDCFIPYIGPKNLRRGQFRDTSYWCQMLDSNGKTAAFLVIHMSFGGKIGSVRLDPGHDLFRFSGVSSAEKPIYLYRQYDTLFAVCGDCAYLFLGDGC